MNKIELFKLIHSEFVKRNNYLDTIPNDIQTAFFDNVYTGSYSLMHDKFITEIFGDNAESVFWFLYEWQPGFEVCVGNDTTVINNIDDYIDWMTKYLDFGV